MSRQSPSTPFSGDDNFEDDNLDSSSNEVQESCEIERILAEEEVEGRRIFLVKWRDYADFRCTWETTDSFESEETLQEWEKQKTDGEFLNEDQVREIQGRMDDYREDREIRRMQRDLKRRKAQNLSPQRIPQLSQKRRLSSGFVRPPHPSIEKLSILAKDAAPLSSIPRPSSSSFPRPSSSSFPRPSSSSFPRPVPFHGVSDAPPRGRTTQGQHGRSPGAPNPRAGRYFKNLSHANNFNKKARTERAPDPNNLELKPIDQIMRPEHDDTALNLPSVNLNSPSNQQELPRTNSVPQASAISDDATSITSNPTAQPIFQVEPQQRFESSKFLVYGLVGPQRSAWWNGKDREPEKDDLIVDFAFGGHAVGKVRLTGVPNPLRRAMIRSRTSKTELPVEFRQERVLQIDEYRERCRGSSNEIWAVGAIDPYNDGAAKALDLAVFLQENRVAAVWDPGPRVASSQTFVLYAPAEPWLFLERNLHVPLRSKMQIAIRNQFPLPTELLPNHPVVPNDGIQASTIEADCLPVPQTIPQSSQHSARKASVGPTTSSLILKQGIKEANSPMRSQTSVALSMEALPDPETLGIKCYHLTRLTPNSKVRFDPSKARFYLCFGNAVLDELACLQGYLEKHTLPKLIYSSIEEDGWETFKETLGTTGENVGVILFHKDWIRYETLPGLALLLRRDNLNVFNISLREPLIDDPKTHLDRLFPRGMVLLITEASIVTDHVTALRIMQWFSSSVKAKSGGWKLMLRPNIDNFLLTSAPNAPPELRKSLLDMLVLLNASHLPRSPIKTDSDLESRKFQREHLNGGVVISPYYLAGYEDFRRTDGRASDSRELRHFQYFTGWTLQNARSYRRFVAVTTLAPENLTNCHHIEIFSPQEFLQATTSKKSK